MQHYQYQNLGMRELVNLVINPKITNGVSWDNRNYPDGGTAVTWSNAVTWNKLVTRCSCTLPVV